MWLCETLPPKVLYVLLLLRSEDKFVIAAAVSVCLGQCQERLDPALGLTNIPPALILMDFVQ